jgi:voltage-gated potassium channel Kch
MRKFSRKLFRIWHHQRITTSIVIVCASLTIILGIIGFSSIFSPSKDKALLDHFYKSIQLFTISLDLQPDQRIPFSLQIARFLGVFVAFSAMAATLLRIFRTTIDESRLRRLEKHVIVCGLSRHNMIFMQRLIDQYDDVVVIEPEKDHQDLGECELMGCHIIRQSFNEHWVLEMAGVRTAKLALVLGNDDLKNTETALLIREFIMMHDSSSIRCIVQISDPFTKQFLQVNYQRSDLHDRFDLEVINYKELLVLSMLAESNFYQDPARNLTHRLIFGDSDYATLTIIRALLDWQMDQHKSSNARLQLTLISPSATKTVNEVFTDYPKIAGNNLIKAIDSSYKTGDFRQGELFPAIDISTVTAIHIMANNDLDSLIIAETVSKHFRIFPILIQIIMKSTGPIAKILSQNFRVFAQDQLASSMTMVMDSRIEILAFAIHHEYQRFSDNQKTRNREEMLTPWSELNEDLKHSCRRQAIEMSRKLSAINCVERHVDPCEAIIMNFAEDEIELLARMEHESWLRERENNGWEYGEAKNLKLKLSPSMQAWDKLSKIDKNYNRSTVRAIPFVLARLGIQICRNDKY